jgi:tetratricopeptide (TPR) repeat protein
MQRLPKGILIVFILFFIGNVAAWAQKPEAIDAYQSGVTYHRLRNYEQAKGFFETAVALDRDFIDAHRSLIDCYEQLGETQLAIDAYVQAIAVAPSDKRLCYNLAMTYIELKEYNQATRYLKKALKIDPLYAKAINRLEEIDQYLSVKKRRTLEAQTVQIGNSPESQHYQEALEAYREKRYKTCLNVLESYEGAVKSANFFYLEAIARQQLGQRAAAKKLYQQALGVDEEHFNSNLNSGRMFYNDGDYRSSVEYLEAAHLRRPNDQKLLFDLAQAYYYNEQQVAASSKLEKYLERNSDDGEAWRMLGTSYSQLGKNKEAAQAFNRAKKYGIGDEDLYERISTDIADKGNQARALTKAGKYEAAIEVLEKAIEEHSEEASLYFNLGLNYLEVGNMRKARTQFARTVELEPDHAKAYQALGMLHYEQEEYKTAGAYYMATLEAGKRDEYVYYKMGSCWYKLNQYEKAIDAYKKAIAINDQEKHFFFSLGSAQLALNKQYKAIESMRKALEIDPQYWEAQYNIAVAYFKMSEYKTSITAAEKILQQNPNFAKAHLIIGHAYHRMGNYNLAREYQDRAKKLDPSLKLY